MPCKCHPCTRCHGVWTRLVVPSPPAACQGNQASSASIENRLTTLILAEDVHGLLSFFLANNAVLEATFAPGSPFGGLGPLHVAAIEGRAKAR